MTLTTHAVGPAPAELTDLSPLVYSRRSRSLYVGPSLGRGRHDRVYNLMQRLGALTPAAADDAHGYYRPDGRFEWDEHFPVPDRLDEEVVRRAIERLLGLAPLTTDPPGRHIQLARRRLRPLKAQARGIAAAGNGLRRRIRPPRPPGEPPERVDDLSTVESSCEFISGNCFASACRYVVNYDALAISDEIDNDWWFCKSDWLEFFFRHVAPDSPFVLFTSNSDRSVGRRFRRYLRRQTLVAWFAVNVAFEDPKLFAIPLGIGDPSAAHGRPAEDLRIARRARTTKARLFDVSFDVRTNPKERLRCLSESGLELEPPLTKRRYLARLASSYFCVAPRGNGIDTHRVWEALYLQTIPVVTRSLLTDQHPDLPLVVLDDWAQFRTVEFSPELYARTLADWQPEAVTFDHYLDRVSRAVDQLRVSARPSKQLSEP